VSEHLKVLIGTRQIVTRYVYVRQTFMLGSLTRVAGGYHRATPAPRYTFNYTMGLVLRKANFLQSFNSSIPIGRDLNIVWRDVDLDRSDLAIVEPHRADGLVTLISGEDHASRCGQGTNQARGKPSPHECFDRWADRLSSLDLGASLTWRPGAGPSSSASCAPSSPSAFPLADYAQRDLAAPHSALRAIAQPESPTVAKTIASIFLRMRSFLFLIKEILNSRKQITEHRFPN